MKKLTLQITKENFDTILSGEQKVEHRYAYSTNFTTYARYKHDGKLYKKYSEIPEDDKPVEVEPVPYDVLYLINGRRKDAPRLTVEVTDIECDIAIDENGDPFYEEYKGETYEILIMQYHLGKVLSTENIEK